MKITKRDLKGGIIFLLVISAFCIIANLNNTRLERIDTTNTNNNNIINK